MRKKNQVTCKEKKNQADHILPSDIWCEKTIAQLSQTIKLLPSSVKISEAVVSRKVIGDILKYLSEYRANKYFPEEEKVQWTRR